MAIPSCESMYMYVATYSAVCGNGNKCGYYGKPENFTFLSVLQ